MAQKRLAQAGLEAASREPVFRLIRGHVYVNASLVHDVMAEVPSVLLSDGVLALLPDDLQADLRERPRAFYDPRTVATVLRLSWNERAWLPWSRAELFREEAARVAAEFGRFRVRETTTPAEIASQLGAVRARLGEFLDVVSWAMIYAYVFFHLALHLADGWLDDSAVPALMSGIPGIRTFDVHRELAALADEVRVDDQLRQRLGEASSRDVVRASERGELGGFGRGLLAIRTEHGHRLVGRDLAFPTWDERPEVLVDMIRRLAVAPPLRPEPDADDMRSRVRSTIGGGAFGAIRLRIFDLGLSWCQEYYAVRENMRYHADYFLAAFRRLAQAGAGHLVASGALTEPDDVFYLTHEELAAGLAGRGAEGLAAQAAARREEYERYRIETPPEVVRGEDVPEDSRDAGSEPGHESVGGPVASLRGTPASPGEIEGIARVVHSVEELDGVESGDIIIAMATDPTWTSYLSLASALVLEVGGLLSHGAIIAREMGIPAVVDLSDATNRIRSGERLRVDGAAGTVQRL